MLFGEQVWDLTLEGLSLCSLCPVAIICSKGISAAEFLWINIWLFQL